LAYVGDERAYACPSYPAPGGFSQAPLFDIGLINARRGVGQPLHGEGLRPDQGHVEDHVLIEEYDHRAEGGTLLGAQGSFVSRYGEVARYVNTGSIPR